MGFQGWEKGSLLLSNGQLVETVLPVVVSASRATDIPAFFSTWFMDSLHNGYIKWVNPFNGKAQYVSFGNTRAIVFWSKNPKPMIRRLTELDIQGINYYFQFTLNDYVKEKWEPLVPPLESRIETFQALSERLGKKRVIWRFDPLILTAEMTVERLLERVAKVGSIIYPYTEKLVFSFADISNYKKVQENLARESIQCEEWTTESMEQIAAGLVSLNKEWGLTLATCAEKLDLATYGIEHNRCVDDRIMVSAFPHDEKLMEFLGYKRDLFNGSTHQYFKDKGQRKECGCIVSKDIGMYDTCPHACVYCYANTSPESVARNRKMFE